MNQKKEEDDQHDGSFDEEDSEYSVTNYFGGNHCPFIEWMDSFKFTLELYFIIKIY